MELNLGQDFHLLIVVDQIEGDALAAETPAVFTCSMLSAAKCCSVLRISTAHQCYSSVLISAHPCSSVLLISAAHQCYSSVLISAHQC